MKDDEMAEIMFLDKHPGWTHDDYVNAPDHIVQGLRELDLARARELAHG